MQQYDSNGWHVTNGEGGPGWKVRPRLFGLVWQWQAWPHENAALATYRVRRSWLVGSRAEAERQAQGWAEGLASEAMHRPEGF